MRLFRHRRTIRKAIIPPNSTTSLTNRGVYPCTSLGAVRVRPRTSQAGKSVDKSVDKFFTKKVVSTPYYPHNEGMSNYETYITQTHQEIRTAIRAYEALPDTVPTQVKKDIWKALVEALNLVQNELVKIS